MPSPQPRSPRSAVLLAMIASLAVGAGCEAKPDAAAAPAKIPARTVRLTPVTVGAVVETVEITGELQGIEEVRVFAQVPERIRTLAVKEGQKVKAGDLLATVWGELQDEAVNQAEAGLEAALANRDAATDNLNRMRSLSQGGSIPKSQLEAAEAQARAAEAQVRQATAAVGSASAQRNRTTIRAPIGGTVAQVALKQGDLAGMGQPIMTIVKADRLKAVLRVPERDFLRMEPDMKVTLAPLARLDQQTEGRISLKGPVVDRLTRTGLIEVNLDQPGELLAGTSVRVTIELSRREGAVLVPASAILFTSSTQRDGSALAFVADGEQARRREVRIGSRQGDQLEITEGLAQGEQIVLQGVHFLRDGNPIVVAGSAQ